MAVTISVEVELGWGVHDIGEYGHLSEDGRAERAALRRLLDQCDAVDVPVSFDVVGHLFESKCAGVHDGPHRSGWFDDDPGTDAVADPLFYAPEAVTEIVDRPTAHELCTHTYSHVLCGDAPAETVAWELDAAQAHIRRVTGSATASLVPPRHSEPPASLLRDADIDIVRLARDTSVRSTARRARELVFGPHPVFEPRLVDGVVETYCTTYPSLTSSTLPAGQEPPPAPFRALPVSLRQRLHRTYLSRSLDAAAESDGDCHLWCHLFDFSNDAQWPPIRAFLHELSARRDRGELEIQTMAEVNDRVRDRLETASVRD